MLGFYWKALFDPMDDLRKLQDKFNQFAAHEIAAQVSHINLLLERHHNEQQIAIDGVAQEVRLLRQEHQENFHLVQETFHRVRTASDILDQMAARSILLLLLN